MRPNTPTLTAINSGVTHATGVADHKASRKFCDGDGGRGSTGGWPGNGGRDDDEGISDMRPFHSQFTAKQRRAD
jgi:hypothetical protein